MEHVTTKDAVKFVESCKEGMHNQLNATHLGSCIHDFPPLFGQEMHFNNWISLLSKF